MYAPAVWFVSSNNCFFSGLKSSFQTLKRTFHALKWPFHTLKCTFHTMKWRFLLAENAISSRSREKFIALAYISVLILMGQITMKNHRDNALAAPQTTPTAKQANEANVSRPQLPSWGNRRSRRFNGPTLHIDVCQQVGKAPARKLGPTNFTLAADLAPLRRQVLIYDARIVTLQARPNSSLNGTELRFNLPVTCQSKNI